MAASNNGVPATVEELAQPPRQDGGEPADPNVFENPVPQSEEAHRGLSGDRYRLKAPSLPAMNSSFRNSVT